MMKKRLLSGVLISAMAVLFAATPVMAEEVGNVEKYSEELSDDLETDELPGNDGSEEYVSDESVSENIMSADSLDDSDIGEGDSLSTVEVYSAEDSSVDDSDSEETESDEDSEPEDYGIVTLAKKADPIIEDGFNQDPDSGDWYYYTNGKIDTGKNSVIKGTVNGIYDWWYVVGGKVQLDFTGLADYSNANGWWYITNGRVDRSVTTVAKNKNGWWYVKNGKVDKSYTGFATNENGSWYMENGKLRRDQNTVIKDTKGALGSTSEWYYVIGSKVQYGFTGLANYKNASGWWYITNGRVDRTVHTVAKNNNGWWYVINGKVDKSYTGFATNENGSWYMENGKLRRDQNTVIKDTKGALGSTSEWYYVIGSKVQSNFTGLANYKNASGWWYITNGKVDRSYNGLAKNNNGWYYLTNGKVDRSYTGFATNENGSWYMESGKLTRKTSGVIRDTNGALGSTSDWYYVLDSKVQLSYSGTVTVDGQTWNVKNGKATLEGSADYEYTLTDDDINYAGKDTTQLAAPVFSGVVDGNNGTMTLTWDAVPGAEKYRVFYKKYGDSSWTKLADTTATSYTHQKWNESSVYFYTVRCISADGSEYMSDYIKSYSGSAVAGYAQQFVGNPYVYGGSSLTNGCDCSGFIMQVYAHFGVYLPHSSTTQITLGKEVSYADAQPGDIIGRSGHTMLYIGNGKVVHAQNAATGICITEVSKTNYTNIRRIY